MALTLNLALLLGHPLFEIFLSSETPKLASLQWVLLGGIPGWIKRPVHKIDQSHPPSVEVRNKMSYTSDPPYALTGSKGVHVFTTFYNAHYQIRHE